MPIMKDVKIYCFWRFISKPYIYCSQRGILNYFEVFLGLDGIILERFGNYLSLLSNFMELILNQFEFVLGRVGIILERFGNYL